MRLALKDNGQMSPLEKIQAEFQREAQAITPGLVAAVDWSRDQIEAEQQRRLRGLLAHAKANSPWHARRLAHIDPETFTADRMEEIPVMTKADLNEHFDEISTDRSVTRAWCEAHLADENPFSDGRYCITSSGGSSGIRALQVSTPQAVAYWLLGVLRHRLRYNEKTQENIDLSAFWIMANVGGAHATNMLGQLHAAEQGGIRMAVTDPLPEIIRQLNEAQPETINLYSSFIRHLVSAQKDGRLQISPKVINFTSETPSLDDIETAKELWGCQLVSSWAAVECNALGNSSGFEDGHLLQDDLAVIEAVNADGSPTPLDTQCDKIFATSLTSPVIPFIRYEITDQVTVYSKPPVCGSGLRAASWVTGRLDDHFTYAGDIQVHSHLFRHILEQRPGILEYQVTQTERGAAVALVPSGPVDIADVESCLARDLEKLGLNDPRVEITRVNSIERTAAQKLKKFVPLHPAKND